MKSNACKILPILKANLHAWVLVGTYANLNSAKASANHHLGREAARRGRNRIKRDFRPIGNTVEVWARMG